MPETCDYQTCGTNGFCVPKSKKEKDLSLCICRKGFSGVRCEISPDVEIGDLFRRKKKGKKSGEEPDANVPEEKGTKKSKKKSEGENDEERSIASLMSIYQGEFSF